MKNFFLLSAVATALLLTGCDSRPSNEQTSAATEQTAQQQAATQVLKSPNDDRAYRTLMLDNGLEVMLISDPSTEKSAASLSVSVGLLHDPMTQQGMAHYLEHMLFLGTEKYPDSNEYGEFMTANGGSQNAYTWLDITNYMFSLNNNAYDEALDRFSDFFKAPKLYPEYTEKEKNAVNAEWSMRREMDFFGQYNLARGLLGEHPANRFLIGNLESLGDKENSNLHTETVDFYNRYYSANIMKAAMISNRSLDELEALAKKHFSAIENKNIEDPTVTTALDFEQVAGKRIHYVPNEEVKQVRLEFIIEDNSDQFRVKPNEFITYLIGSEMEGTPAHTLKAMGLISSLNAYASPTDYGNYGTLNIMLELTDAGMQQREMMIASIMQYIEKIRAEGVDEKYFAEIKTSLNNRFQFLEKGNQFSYVSNLAESMQNVPANYAIAAPYVYEAFDAQAINAVLDQLTPERLRVWYVSKQEPSDSELHFYDGKYQVVDITAEEMASWGQEGQLAFNLPTVNRLMPENFALVEAKEQAKPEIVLESEGMTVWHYPSQLFADQPRGILEIAMNNGRAQEDVKAAVLLDLWRDLFNLEQSALRTEASVAGMQFNFNTGSGVTLRVSGFTDKQPVLLQEAIANLVVEADEQSFANAVDRFVRGLRNQGKQFPFYQAFGAYNKLIREGNFNTEQLIATAESLKPADLTAFANDQLSNNHIRVFAFGNYAISDLENVVTVVDAALPAERQSTDYDRARFIAPAEKQRIVWQENIDVADVGMIDVHVHPEPGFATQAAGNVLSAHFSNIAFDKLRTEEQLAYAVGGTATAIDEYTGFAMYIQTPVNDVATMQARFDAFKGEYEERLNALTQEEFEQLKASALVSLKEPPKNMSEEVSPLINDWYRERFDFDSKQQLIAAVEAVTLDDIKGFYQQTMLNPDAARISVQMRGTKFLEQPFAELPNQQVVESLAKFHADMAKQ